MLVTILTAVLGFFLFSYSTLMSILILMVSIPVNRDLAATYGQSFNKSAAGKIANMGIIIHIVITSAVIGAVFIIGSFDAQYGLITGMIFSAWLSRKSIGKTDVNLREYLFRNQDLFTDEAWLNITVSDKYSHLFNYGEEG